MNLSRESVEFAHFDFTGLPDNPGVPQVFLVGAWRDMAWVQNSGTTRTARILVAGPDAPPGGAVTLPYGRTTPRVRLVDNPETVIRDAPGSIDVA